MFKQSSRFYKKNTLKVYFIPKIRCADPLSIQNIYVQMHKLCHTWVVWVFFPQETSSLSRRKRKRWKVSLRKIIPIATPCVEKEHEQVQQATFQEVLPTQTASLQYLVHFMWAPSLTSFTSRTRRGNVFLHFCLLLPDCRTNTVSF